MFEGRPWVVILSGLSLIAIWTFGFRIHDEIFTLIHGQSPSQQEEAVFLETAMAVEFPAPMDYAPLQEVCARSAFRPGLLFTCDGQHGGIGMVRNQILKCVRYAMHAGAALVLPTMAQRSAADLAEILTATELPLDYLLDRPTFVAQLAAACPQMRVYERAEDFATDARTPPRLLHLVGSQFEPDSQPTPQHTHVGLAYPGAWRYLFDQWLAQQLPPPPPPTTTTTTSDSVAPRPPPSAEAPVHVLLGQSYLEYPVRADGGAFAREFGKVLSFRRETRALAARALLALRQRGLVPRGLDPARFVHPDAYYGAHLRLEADALWAWPPEAWRFSRMAAQFEAHYAHVARTGLRTVYVASGNQTATALFAARLRARFAGAGRGRRGVTVVTKHDLLQGEDRQRLDNMTFDQQALVDFVMLSKASAFMGVAHSSYSWNIALRRHELSRYAAFGNNGSDLLQDEYSVIMGMEADYPYVDPFVNALWP